MLPTVLANSMTHEKKVRLGGLTSESSQRKVELNNTLRLRSSHAFDSRYY